MSAKFRNGEFGCFEAFRARDGRVRCRDNDNRVCSEEIPFSECPFYK